MHYTRQMKINRSGIGGITMDNFEDMSLEELQQLLQINKKDPEQVKRIQQLSGLTGKAVDGLWGKQTEKAWNNYMDSNQNEIEDNIREIQAHQNAMERGQINPQVVDVLGDFKQLDEQKKARDAKIAELESQIAMVEERIARNERALMGKSYEDANNKIAALEMKKINSTDPTSIWRWQQQRQDTKESNDNVKANEVAKFANTVDMWVNTRPAPTTEGIMQQISGINTSIRDGKNAGADVSKLEAKKKELEGLIYGDSGEDISSTNYGKGTKTEQDAGQLKTILSTAKTSKELMNFKNSHKDLTPEQVSLLDVKIKELQEKEKARADEASFRAWVKKESGMDASSLSDRALKTYRNAWNKLRGK